MDFVAAIFALIGVYLITNKNRWGFILCLCSGLTWILVALSTHVYGLLLEVLPLVILNVRGFIKWSRK